MRTCSGIRSPSTSSELTWRFRSVAIGASRSARRPAPTPFTAGSLGTVRPACRERSRFRKGGPEWDARADRRPAARRGLDAKRAAHRAHAIHHVRHAGAAPLRGHVEARAAVLDLEYQPVGFLLNPHRGGRALASIFAGVL